MKTFSASVQIQAPPEAVWSILIDGARWTEWNPTVEKVDGRIAPGGRVTVVTRQSPGRAFPLRVTAFEPPRRMVWTGGMPLGLFTGVRTYRLEPTGNGVRFTMTEEFSGLLARFILPSIPDLQPAFEAFAAAFKERAERDQGTRR